MKERKDNRPVWIDSAYRGRFRLAEELVLKDASPHEVTFVNDVNYERERTKLTFTRDDWNRLGNPVVIQLGVWT